MRASLLTHSRQTATPQTPSRASRTASRSQKAFLTALSGPFPERSLTGQRRTAQLSSRPHARQLPTERWPRKRYRKPRKLLPVHSKEHFFPRLTGTWPRRKTRPQRQVILSGPPSGKWPQSVGLGVAKRCFRRETLLYALAVMLTSQSRDVDGTTFEEGLVFQVIFARPKTAGRSTRVARTMQRGKVETPRRSRG